MSERSFNIFADYFQFLVRDARADWEDLADQWTPEAVRNMFVQGDGYIGVGTVRNMHVPLIVRTSEVEPPADQRDWDRIVHGSLSVPSGEIDITGVTDNGLSGGQMRLTAGHYHVRALYGDLESISEDGLSGADRYVIELWPASAESPAPTDPEFVKV